MAVTDYLRQRFDQDKVYLLGHLGQSDRHRGRRSIPERYHAYLAMAQMVHQLESEKLAYDYMLAEYRKRGDTTMVRDLEAAPVSMTTGTPDAYLKLRDKAMHRLGVGTTHDMTSVITGCSCRRGRSRRYTLPEKVNCGGGAFSRSFGLWDQLIRIDL